MNVNSLLSDTHAKIRRAGDEPGLGTVFASSGFIVLNVLIVLYILGMLGFSAALFGVQRAARMFIVAIAPLLMAAMWMDRQPSPKPYREIMPPPPADSVPLSGKETVSRDVEHHNPVPPTAASLSRGEELFAVNCAMCHGHSSAARGPVGMKLTPPPPGLDHELLRERSDDHIFTAIAFGFGRMPPFKGKLSPEERWHLVNYLRTRK